MTAKWHKKFHFGPLRSHSMFAGFAAPVAAFIKPSDGSRSHSFDVDTWVILGLSSTAPAFFDNRTLVGGMDEPSLRATYLQK